MNCFKLDNNIKIVKIILIINIIDYNKIVNGNLFVRTKEGKAHRCWWEC